MHVPRRRRQTNATTRFTNVDEFLHEVLIASLLSIFAFSHAAIAFFADWTDPARIDNCGDRLFERMYGPRKVATSNGPMPAYKFNGLTPRQVLGIGIDFTIQELRQARRRLALRLHPDRWPNATATERRAREDSLKQANAAFDELKAEARA